MTKPNDVLKALIWKGFQCVRANGVASGVNRESIEKIESRLVDSLGRLWNRLSSGSYIPPLVKGAPIPKKSRGVRMLGVPALGDRVAQALVKMLLEPVFEPLFTAFPTAFEQGDQLRMA